ncbi:hypothetical protein MMC29_002516 [Sticta canariensis]|nr:hypothetical protein [Sticta canariensis]
MPCSSYLTSQSSYISNFNYFPDAIKPYWPAEWKVEFGRSPECSSYAEVWRNQAKYTFSNCGSNDAIVTASPGIVLPHQIPPGVLRQVPFLVYECCGNCTLDVSEVRLYYFRDEAGNSSHCQANQTLVSQPTYAATANKKRARTIPASSNIAIVSGYTFTSPSVYLEIVGTAAVADSCAPVGAVFTNPIIALPPGELMTYSPQLPFTVGEKYFDANGVLGFQFLGFKKSLNIAELECPTFGVGLATSAYGRVSRTYGPPYLPIIIPPRQIFSLDPTWEKYCADFVSYSPGLRSFAIFDPPRILTPVAALLPPSTSAPAIVPTSRTPDPVLTREPQIQPARTTLPSIPKATVVSVAPGVPPSESKLPLLFPAPPVNAPVDPDMFSNAERTLSPTLSGQQQIADPKEDHQSLGAIIYDAFGGGYLTKGQTASQPNGVLPTITPAETQNHDDGTHLNIRPLTPNVLTIAGQIITANPSEIVIAGTTLLPDGPGMPCTAR